ncbi:MAG: monofunctional biosynthetic peptidoglycan transglycosylase, partial [Gammaproteobacteria bacterium]|nr:monofunctional biosynthetic peptidoglycan transglycosylase [Gammaproteobacteria bacterium]
MRLSRRRRRNRGNSKRWRWPRRVAAAVCVIVLLSWLPVLALRWLDPPTTAFMLLDADAREDLDYEWTDWASISSSVPLAVVASEDQKFSSHFGFDIESIRDAIDDSQNGGRLRGASTISQQVAKNLFLWNGRSFVRKGIEAYFTVLIELTWPKQRILEVYVNVAEFGPGIFGVGAASRRFFAGSPSTVSDAQAA